MACATEALEKLKRVMQNESQQGDQIWLFTNTVKTQFKYWPVFARNLAIFARNLSNLATILDET